MVEAHIQCRVAAPDDAVGIFGVLAEVAQEIPLRIDTGERREAIFRIIEGCIGAGESRIATDGGGGTVGFVLVEPDEIERFQRNNHALHLRYTGVAKAQRRRGIFRALVRQLMKRSVPLTATVKAGNKCQMAVLLQHVGFQKWSGDPQTEEHFKWQPI